MTTATEVLETPHLEMTAEVHEEWVTALESGEYRQGVGALHQRGDKALGTGGGQPDLFCCLGVLCHLAAKAGQVEVNSERPGVLVQYGNEVNYLPEEVVKWAGLRWVGERTNHTPLWEETRGRFSTGGRCLAAMNDGGESFMDIAKTIRERVRAV